jgi:hypothetical protein
MAYSQAQKLEFYPYVVLTSPNLFALGLGLAGLAEDPNFPIYQDHQLETRGLSESFSAFKLPVVSRHYLSIVLSIQYPAKDTHTILEIV